MAIQGVLVRGKVASDVSSETAKILQQLDYEQKMTGRNERDNAFQTAAMAEVSAGLSRAAEIWEARQTIEQAKLHLEKLRAGETVSSFDWQQGDVKVARGTAHMNGNQEALVQMYASLVEEASALENASSSQE